MSEKMSLKSLRDLVVDAEHRLTGKKFCPSCQAMKSEGKMVGEKYKRFQCVDCLNKVSQRLYERKK
jgi:hypothetical protein